MVMGRKKTPAASAVTTTESTVNDVAADLSGATSSPQQHMPSIRLIPHQDPRATRPSLLFSPISRTLPSHAAVIRVGRYSEKDSEPPSSTNTPSAAPVGFKSKVVSRRHCELWCANGQWHIKDVKSSSGTFLNHIRLSQPNSESKPFPVNDGDVIQLGIDFKGGEEMIFRCVKIRVECNRGWQKALNNFNTTTHKRLRDLAAVTTDSKGITPSSECSICLFSIAPCQSLFVAPCSHVWHYSCIRPILNGTTWPQFLCPNCRAVADLEAEVDEPSADWARQLNDADAVPASRDAALVSTPLGPNGEVAPPPDKRPGKEEPERPASNLADAVGALTLEATEPGDGASDPPLPLRESDFPSGTHAPSVRPSLASRRSDSVQALDLAAPSTPSGTGTSVRQASRELSDNWLSSDRETDAADTTVHSPDPPGPDGPLTPTNDAGPFVFDGSAGREAEA
ncbi:MAG: hypothetical protein M1838_000814 [Thelocarpon superellum]|nr:MAG: hypothetical protein M1838_000814 [Thelocarpon superellum]